MGKLGTTTSSRRFKEDIKPMNSASETLFALKPVTFRYKKEIDPQGTPQFGLVAEEVEKVNPKLVVRDKEGKVNTVRYEAVNAMLLNEFLKEHKKVEQLEATVAQQRKDFKAAMARHQKELEATRTQQQNEIEVLTASFKEQAAQIQKVSAQVKMSKPPPRLVTNR
jgi:septal ring factor EnvC (AmiA/AmiB activator)